MQNETLAVLPLIITMLVVAIFGAVNYLNSVIIHKPKSVAFRRRTETFTDKHAMTVVKLIFAMIVVYVVVVTIIEGIYS